MKKVSWERRMERMKEYEKIRLLGSGGMSEVWLVEDKSNGQTYAMKEAKQHTTHSTVYRNALHKEAHILAGIHHPMIPSLIAYEPRTYFIMDLIEGHSLETHMTNGIPDSILYGWMKEVIEILSYLHHHKIFYLDLKPQNLMEDANGKLHLVDFGTSVYQDGPKVSAITPRLWSA